MTCDLQQGLDAVFLIPDLLPGAEGGGIGLPGAEGGGIGLPGAEGGGIRRGRGQESGGSDCLP